MMERIIEYFKEEKRVTAPVAKVLADKLTRYEDIKNEFIYWLEHRSFDMDNPVVVNGYSAQKVCEINPLLDAAGIYDFLITMRENPDKAEEYIAKNFPSK